ncbi:MULTISPECIES: Fic family protein [Lactobacillus]|nr:MULTISPECIES: Fic family protein [Lactobacillus]
MKYSQLTDLKEEINRYRPLTQEEVTAIEKEKKIDHVWSSNAIEGSSLTKYETAALLETGLTVHGKPFADHLAALDLSRAYDYVQELATGKIPLDETAIRDINRLVTYSDDPVKREAAGQYRQIEVWPNGVPEVHYAKPTEIKSKMQGLLKWYHSVEGQEHPVKIAALLHLKFVTIHPFRDGNGRTARLLMNFELIKHGYLIINIQPDKDSRSAYMEALRLAQVENHNEDFLKLVADYELYELKDRLQLLKRIEEERRIAEKQTRLNDVDFS